MARIVRIAKPEAFNAETIATWVCTDPSDPALYKWYVDKVQYMLDTLVERGVLETE